MIWLCGDTHIGQKRQTNQDVFFAELLGENALIMVCDGMGGALGGAAVCIVTAIALQLMNIDGAVGATTVISTLVRSLFLIQGVAALTRRMKESGSGKGMRTALLVLAVLFAGSFVELAGVGSALIGRKGVITNKMRQKIEERRKDEDE